jgi:hypothetical protein
MKADAGFRFLRSLVANAIAIALVLALLSDVLRNATEREIAFMFVGAFAFVMFEFLSRAFMRRFRIWFPSDLEREWGDR